MPTGCILDNGYNLGCATTGGIKNVYLGTYDPTVTYDDTTDPEGKITLLVDNPNAIECWDFQQDLEFAGLEQTGNFSQENGTVFYESVLSMKFIHMDSNLRDLINALGRAPIFAVVEANSGEWFILGTESPGRATEGNSSLGVAMGDMNGATLSFTFKAENSAPLTIAGILNTGAADPTLITLSATI